MARIAVLGGGAGGHAAAADCALAGHAVTWAELPERAEALAPVRATCTIQVLGRGSEPLRATLEHVTTDVAEAVSHANLFLVVAAPSGQEAMCAACAPHLRDGQTVVFFGGVGGSLMLRQILQRRKVRADVLVGETNNLPYMARLQAPGRVVATRKAGGTLLAACPGQRTTELFGRLEDLWPYLRPASNVLEVLLVNFDAIDRVAPVVCNAGGIETHTTPFLLYGEGVSPAVARVIEAVDNEILALRAALGFPDRTSFRDYLVKQGLLDAPQASTYQAIQRSALALGTFQRGPDALRARNMAEDVAYPQVLIASIGDAVGVDTPVIDGLIALASALIGEDYRRTGRTLATLGLAGLGREALLRTVNEGP
jgi:opine dehydrogenase